MSISKIHLETFTVFENTEIELSPGINVFIGENGTGKTHILKLLYSACQAAKVACNFRKKIMDVFCPDKIGHLVSRNPGIGAEVNMWADTINPNVPLRIRFTGKDDVEELSGQAPWVREFKNRPSIFIPAKEILSNSNNLIQAIIAENVDFDDTYKDIIVAASINISKVPDTDRKRQYLEKMQRLAGGEVIRRDEKFYLQSDEIQSEMEFPLLAEGLRKFALLWQLIKNGYLEKGSILFWDEPEANINPKNISAIARLLLDLEEDGVQIFVASHDYFFCKYIDVLKTKKNRVAYHALHKKDNVVRHEQADDFQLLENNSIIDESIRLYKEEVMKVME